MANEPQHEDNDKDMEPDFDWGEEENSYDSTDEFIERIETTGSEAFNNIPAEVYQSPGTISLAWRMGYQEDVIQHFSQLLKDNVAFRQELVMYDNPSKEQFFDLVEEEGYIAFYKVNPERLAQPEWIDGLCQMGYQSEMMEHYPLDISSRPEFLQKLSQYNTVFKTVTVNTLFHKKETPENGDENVWGQRESHEHFRATLTIDEKTFLFDKHVHFSPLHQTDEIMMEVNFYLNNHYVANSNICIDEESHIYNKPAFALLKRFKLMEANVPKVESFQINFYQKNWDSLFALQATNGNNKKMKNS